MYGTDGEHEFVWEGRKGAYRYRDRFEGAVPRLERRFAETGSEDVRRELERYMSFAPCGDCGGSRLRREALAVKISGSSLVDVSNLPVNRDPRVVQRSRAWRTRRQNAPTRFCAKYETVSVFLCLWGSTT